VYDTTTDVGSVRLLLYPLSQPSPSFIVITWLPTSTEVNVYELDEKFWYDPKSNLTWYVPPFPPDGLETVIDPVSPLHNAFVT